ncbi:uncharacterized protein METZ01_LOCUS430994 [marine metagenome]|uniref:Uncharacterized protein n=1 Tax=marine metagenome TaxID=408172 RepID=A0A382Y4T0_9ZZZZ
MIDKIKGLKKGAILYIALIIVLLIIVMNQSGSIKDLESGLSDANDTIISRESSIESMEEKHGIAVAILDSAIAGLELSAVDINAKLNDVDTQRGNLESEVVNLQSQLSDASAKLEDALTNPNCPVTE